MRTLGWHFTIVTSPISVCKYLLLERLKEWEINSWICHSRNTGNSHKQTPLSEDSSPWAYWFFLHFEILSFQVLNYFYELISWLRLCRYCFKFQNDSPGAEILLEQFSALKVNEITLQTTCKCSFRVSILMLQRRWNIWFGRHWNILWDTVPMWKSLRIDITTVRNHHIFMWWTVSSWNLGHESCLHPICPSVIGVNLSDGKGCFL